MKLSDLVKASAGEDPEIVILEDWGDDSGLSWVLMPLEERVTPEVREIGGKLLLTAVSTILSPVASGRGDFSSGNQ